MEKKKRATVIKTALVGAYFANLLWNWGEARHHEEKMLATPIYQQFREDLLASRIVIYRESDKLFNIEKLRDGSLLQGVFDDEDFCGHTNISFMLRDKVESTKRRLTNAEAQIQYIYVQLEADPLYSYHQEKVWKHVKRAFIPIYDLVW